MNNSLAQKCGDFPPPPSPQGFMPVAETQVSCLMYIYLDSKRVSILIWGTMAERFSASDLCSDG